MTFFERPYRNCALFFLALWGMSFGIAQEIPNPIRPNLPEGLIVGTLPDTQCFKVTGQVGENGEAYLPHFRVYRDMELSATVNGKTDAAYQVTLLEWQDGLWIPISESSGMAKTANLSAFVKPGFYCWKVSSNIPAVSFNLCEVLPIDQLIMDFAGPDLDAADAAYYQLFELGLQAVPHLMELAYTPGKYAGGAYISPLSSTNLDMEKPLVSQAALLLIDAIFYGNATPHLDWRLFGGLDGETQEQLLEQAIALYQAWWSQVAGMTLEQIQLLPHPLDSVGISFLGPVIPNVNINETGKPVPGSETPKHPSGRCLSQPDGPDNDTKPDPYSWKYKPKNPGGPTPYNCMAWALGCQTDRWINPVPGAGGSWKDVLDDHGYDTANPSNATDACADGKGPKVKMIFFEWEHGVYTVQELVHVMKQEDDGDWTSKNGDGKLYKDIKDCAKFLDKHYPTPKGKRRVVKYYCKK